MDRSNKKRKEQTISTSKPHFEVYQNTPECNMDVALFYEKMVEENKLKRVFYDGSMETLQEFTKFVKEKTWFYFGYSRYKLVGGVWFTTFLEKSCNIHICSFRGYNAKEFEEPIKELLQMILDNEAFMCYKIKVSTPYKGLSRRYKGFGFKLVSQIRGEYILEVTK